VKDSPRGKFFRNRGLTRFGEWVIKSCYFDKRLGGLEERKKKQGEGLTGPGVWVKNTVAAGAGSTEETHGALEKELDSGAKVVIIISTENLLFEN
jgi:hypothetical protein